MLEILQKHRGSISVQELSEMLNFRTDDIVKTLQAFYPFFPNPTPGPTPTPNPSP